MEMRLLKESVQLEQPTGSGRSQAMVEGELTLPGGLREEARVLQAGGMAAVDTVEATQDHLTVTGRVVFHVLYTQGDPEKISAMEATADFTHLMELPGAQPRGVCQAEATVEHVEATAYSGRLALKATVAVCGRALSRQPVEALTGVTGVPGVQLRTRELTAKRTVAAGNGETLLREEFALPEGLQVRETLYAVAQPQLNGVSGGMSRAGVTGSVQLEAYHASDLPGKPLVVTRHVIPFEHAVELSGEDGDVLSAALTVRDVAVASQETADGERVLRAEIVLGVSAWADRRETVTLLDDAYTVTGDDLKLTVQPVCCRVDDRRAQAAESGKALLMLPEGSPAVRGVLCAFASPVMTGREQVGGRLTVEGMMEVTLLYMTDDSAVPVVVRQEEPFRITFAAESGEEDFITLTVSDVDVSAITSDRVEMKYILHLAVNGVATEQARLVVDASSVSAPAASGGIVLYFVQPGETLWDIARRYRVPTEELRSLNPELTGEPDVGQGVVVWHRCREELCG